ncbi:MAG: GGDEF domain-containing protein [Candidatus Omnitrophica bacterium]|nr:GGDEF domain-containing protein [Candidatus Omnitrophota bacterium]
MILTRQKFLKLSEGERHLWDVEKAIQKILILVSALALLAALGVGYMLYEQLGTLPVPIRLTLILLLGLLGAILIQSILLTLIDYQWIRLEKRGLSDPLTGLLNRAGFEEMLAQELRRVGRYHAPLSLCVIDLDSFRSFQENFGKRLAEELLKRFGDFLQSNVRFSDCIGRGKNDEYYVFLPQTDLIRAAKFLDRLIHQSEDKFDCTFSAGLTAYRGGESTGEMITRSETALEHAKKEGKSRIRCLIESDDSFSVLSL